METIACDLCGEPRSVTLFTKWGLNVVRCTGCGLAFVNPRTFNVEDDSYFQGAYLSTIERDGELEPGIQSIYDRVLGHLGTVLNPSRLLDVGCAMGHFMKVARDRGWRVMGVECSAYAAAHGWNRWKLPIQTVCDLREAKLPPSFFDACVMIEVIEHLPNPKTVLAEAFRLLKPGGVLYITTPNFERYAALIQQADWPAVVHTGHLYYFSIETLTAMARAVGFEDIIDLTGPAIFESEVARVGGAGPTLEAIRGRCSTADAGRAINGRAEGLAAAPFKPRTGPQSLQADRRWTAPMPRLEGRLVGGNGQTEEDRKVYIVQRGKKHWVLSTDWLEQRGMRISDTVQVDSRLLAAILTGEPVG